MTQARTVKELAQAYGVGICTMHRKVRAILKTPPKQRTQLLFPKELELIFQELGDPYK